MEKKKIEGRERERKIWKTKKETMNSEKVEGEKRVRRRVRPTLNSHCEEEGMGLVARSGLHSSSSTSSTKKAAPLSSARQTKTFI